MKTEINCLIDQFKNYLINLKIRNHKQIEGFISINEAIELYKIATYLPQKSIAVEIGSWKGKSTYCIAKGLKNGKIIAIDPFDASGDQQSAIRYRALQGDTILLKQFKERMNNLGVINKIDIYQGFSQEFVNVISAIDFLFIDGDHSIEGCYADFVNYSPHIKTGGYIAFHDYYASRSELGPTWVINNKVLLSNQYKFIKLVDSLWIGQKS